LNFCRVKQALKALELDGQLQLKRDNLIVSKRLNSGIFRGVNFVVNATRLYSEIENRTRIYRPLCHVELECKCVSATESIFRPAIYKVDDLVPIHSKSLKVRKVSKLVSMIGMYRDTIKKGERIRALGMLERVKEPHKKLFYRVVVGSSHVNEHIEWIEY
jgi:predicted nucleotidyltransferase